MPKPFERLAAELPPLSPLRMAIARAYRARETACISGLIDAATPDETQRAEIAALARELVTAVRTRPETGLGSALMQEYALGSDEGLALMSMAESLLRIPDPETRNHLLQEKLSGGDWASHVGLERPAAVNLAGLGLSAGASLIGERASNGETSLLRTAVSRAALPVVRRSAEIGVRQLGGQFVCGETIEDALHHARSAAARGFSYSFDMLGEAALTAADAARYFESYRNAIEAIGHEARGAGIFEGPGISIKLSALHPRYSRANGARLQAELLPRLLDLLHLARTFHIGVNIDAEEAERLDISLDLLEAACQHPALAHWNGLGFVVQAYQKRCPFVIDHLIDLARRSGRRLMVRLVKGAYWDSEIKRAQVDGHTDYPVFTRKVHTDVSYLACARKLLAAPDAIFPQFATHNAQTVAAIYVMAGASYARDRYEFQCLHGMGERLFSEVVGPDKLKRACRIYAPVGPHDRLLPYLVRRLLENGANSSFVNKIADPAVSIEELIEEPDAVARRIAPLGAAHPDIPLPSRLYGDTRKNASTFDLTDELMLRDLSTKLMDYSSVPAMPWGDGHDMTASGEHLQIVNPADHSDRIGSPPVANAADVERAFEMAMQAQEAWSRTPVTARAAMLRRVADDLEAQMDAFVALIVREAGKTIPNAIGDVREAVDFLRYYAAEAVGQLPGAQHRPLGLVACISPWNFPLAIFIGQVAAALVTGNAVLAKPAEETPHVALRAAEAFARAGVPDRVVQILIGDGAVGARLVADARTNGVMFTGSTAVARLIRQTLAARTNPDGTPVPFVAETGGLNAMIVESSALVEQVVVDVLQSAFDSAGQRCSALRVLCLQDDIADHVLEALKGAMAELRVDDPSDIATDVGPVITREAATAIEQHIARLAERGCTITRAPLGASCTAGTFVAPALIELADLGLVTEEVFGPVLHVVRYAARDIDALIAEINGKGYGLTFGLHTRLSSSSRRIAEKIHAGNIYINRNTIGAVVGVQPFGGQGLSGTGPKAGGPNYLARLVTGLRRASIINPDAVAAVAACRRFFAAKGVALESETTAVVTRSLRTEMPGPVGEANVYELVPKGRVLCVADSEPALAAQVLAALAAGNKVLAEAGGPAASLLERIPQDLGPWIALCDRHAEADAILFSGPREALIDLQMSIAQRQGPIIPIGVTDGGNYPLVCLYHERSTSTNTAAIGGNPAILTTV